MDLQKTLKEASRILNINTRTFGNWYKDTGVSAFLVLLFLIFEIAEEYWKCFQSIGEEMGDLMDVMARQSGYIQISPRVGSIMELQKVEEAEVSTAENTSHYICDGIIFIPHTR